ncbi:MAG: DNA N-6-adenine-methyltransferase [Rhodospirillaceae bacterium]
MKKNQCQKSSIGATVRKARGALNLSQAELGSRAGLTKMAVAQIENGGGRLDTLLALADILDLSIGGKGVGKADKPIGGRLLSLRGVRNLSQRAVAAMSDISAPTVGAIESGETRVHLSAVVKLAKALGGALKLVPRNAAPPWYKLDQQDHWTTPPDLAAALASAVGGHFDLDVASPGESASPIPARKHFTMADDGLVQPWFGAAYMNPPYGRGVLRKWLAKARAEVEAGHAEMVVALLPSNTGTLYWRDHIGNGKAQHHKFLCGRLSFGEGEGPATFDSVVVVWGGTKTMHQQIDEALRCWEAGRKGKSVAANDDAPQTVARCPEMAAT